MELSNDNWRHIFTYLTPTHLILLKTCNSHLYKLVSSVYGNNLGYSIVEIVYNNYYSLFINYLYPMIGHKKVFNLAYYVGLSCSKEFAKCDKLGLKQTQLFEGALRSGNLEFIKWICDELFSNKTIKSTSLKHIVRSMSKECVDYMLKRYRVEYSLNCMSLRTFAKNPLDLKVGFHANLTADYIDYLMYKRRMIDKKTVLTCAHDCDVNIIKHLLSKGCIPNSDNFRDAVEFGKDEIAKLYFEINPKCVTKDISYVVSSEQCYHFVKSCNLEVNIKDSFINALINCDKKFVSFLCSNGVTLSKDILREVLPLWVDMISHLKDLGLNIPSDIYKFMYDNGIACDDIEFIQYLQEHDYYDPNYTDKYIFEYCDLRVIEKYLTSLASIPEYAYEYMTRNEEPDMLEYLYDSGHILPPNTCNMIVATGYYDIDFIIKLLKNGYQVSPESFLQLAKDNQVDTIEYLISERLMEVTMDMIAEVSLIDARHGESGRNNKDRIIRLLVDRYANQHK